MTSINPMKRSFLSLFICACLGMACTKVVDFQPQVFNPEVIVYGPIVADSPVLVSISQSQSYYGWDQPFDDSLALDQANASFETSNQSIALSYKDSLAALNSSAGIPAAWNQEFSLRNLNLSVFDVFTTPQTFSPGQWVDFEAVLNGNQARTRFYIPKRGSVSPVVDVVLRDTVYPHRNVFQEGRETEEWEFRGKVPFEGEVAEGVTHKVVARVPRWNYSWDIDRETEIYSKVDSEFQVITLTLAADFSTGAEEGDMNVSLALFNQSIFREEDEFGSRFSAGSFQTGIIDLRAIPAGDTVTVPLTLYLISMYDFVGVSNFYNSVFNQGLGAGQVFNEPSPLQSQLAEGIGFMTGYTISAPVETSVRLWRPENLP